MSCMYMDQLMLRCLSVCLSMLVYSLLHDFMMHLTGTRPAEDMIPPTPTPNSKQEITQP